MGSKSNFGADCDLVREVLIKDFDVFVDHGNFFNDETTPYARKFLPIVKGNEWKTMRNHTSPMFSSGKLKKLIPLIDVCAQNLAKAVEKSGRLNNGHA